MNLKYMNFIVGSVVNIESCPGCLIPPCREVTSELKKNARIYLLIVSSVMNSFCQVSLDVLKRNDGVASILK